MAEASSKDPATLAALHPARTREVQYRDYKNSLQLFGSQFMSLKRPTRLPEAGREYTPGDPVNLIDWKAYGRLGQLIVREVRDQSTSRVLIGVDVSATMQWPSSDVPQPVAATKAEVALRLALHLAHLHLRMGDLVEVWLQSDARAAYPEAVFKPRRGAEIIALYEHWVAQDCAVQAIRGEFQAAPWPQAKRDRAFWLGDALGGAKVADVLLMGKKSMFIHVLSSLELQIDWLQSSTSYFDQEAGRELREYQGPVLKRPGNYLAQLSAWCDDWRLRLQRQGCDYVRLTETTQVASYLSSLEDFIQSSGAGPETGASRR